MDRRELRTKIDEAKNAVFAVEKMFPPNNDDRRRIYALRVQLGYLGAEILGRVTPEDY